MQQERQSPNKLPGLCYSCHKPGHWANNCPEKTHHNRTPVPKPVISHNQCRCGAGFCEIRVSNTVAHPNENYLACPSILEMNCGYFKFCKKLDEVREVPPPVRYPICECQAGVCTVLVEQNGVNAGRSYFACRVRKGEGACNFKLWVDEAPETASVTSGNPLANQTIFTDEFELSCEDVMQIDAVERIACDKHIYKDRAQIGGEVCASPMETLAAHARPYSVENYVSENLDPKMTIQSSESLTNQTCNSPVHVMQGCVTAATLNKGSPQGLSPNLNTPPEYLSPSSSQSRGGLFSNLQSPLKNGLREGDKMSGSISATFEMLALQLQDDLIMVLESMSPQSHELMSKEADCAFSALNNLQVDYKPFHSRVNEYIKRAASLAHIEQIISEDTFIQELVNHRDNEQRRFDELSKSHSEAKAALASLLEKASSDDTELAEELLSCVLQITRTLNECKKSLHAASQKAEEALKKSKVTETELNAAQVAFQTARAQLRN